MYSGILKTLDIYWTSAVSLPHFNLAVVVLQIEVTALVLEKLLIVDILSIRYIDYLKL